MDPSARWKFERGRTFEARRPWAVAIGVVYLAGLAFALRRQPDWAAAVLGIGAIPVGLELGNYYFAITTGFACLAARRPEVGLGLLALSAFTWWVGRWGGEDRDLVVALASAGTLVFVGFVTVRLALAPLLSARSLLALLLAGFAGSALPGCSRPPSPPNLLLVVVDSLRADHLSAYGHRRPTSPALDALAGRGVRFTRAYATAPWTKPSVASLFTGLAPSAHGVQRVPGPLSPQLPSLPESLARAGFATGGVVSHSLIGSRFGFERGFEVFLESEARGASHLSSEGVTRQAIELLDRLTAEGRPFFLFVHYFDPHYTYRRHPEYGFAGRGTGRLRGEEPIQVLRRLRESLSPAEVALVRDVYDEEVRFTDEAIGRLLSALEERDLASRTWVFVTADHGEEFLERGHFGHTRTLHEELVRVPLIAAGPDALPRVVDAPVSLASLPATLLELTGAAPAAAFEAPSLAPLLRGGSAATPPPLFEVDFVPTLAENAGNRAHQRGLVADGFKLIENLESGRVSLFDLSADPDERVDLAERRPGLVWRLRDRLAAAHDRMRPPVAPERAAPLPPAEIERLRELGYLED
jgi:arylsulfatase A-like enzyme